MKIKAIFTALAMTAVLFAPASCSSDDNKKDENITWSVATFSYTTDGTAKHASYDAFKSELEAACTQCEGKDKDAAKPVIDAVFDKYAAPAYRPYVVNISVTSSNGWKLVKSESLL